MQFSVFIKRPVFALMINLALLVAGLFAYTRLNVEAMPEIDITIVTITTRLEGASPELIESQITKPIENSVAIISGLDNIRSACDVGESTVQVTFQLGVDGNSALQQCRDKVGGVAINFPQGTSQSTFARYSSDEQPVLTLALSSRRPVRELTEIAEFEVAEKLHTVSGVGDVVVKGGQKREVKILLDLVKLQELKLTINSVVDALRSHNTQVPGGSIRSRTNQYVLTVDGKLRKIQEFANIVVEASRNQRQSVQQDEHLRVVRLSDVAEVADSEAIATSFSRLNGEPVVTLDVKKTGGANLLKVVSGVRDRIDSLKKTLPADVDLRIVRDNSTSINQSVDDLKMDLLLGAGLACLAVLLFLGNIRLTLIAAVAIPISLVATLAFMSALGYTLNYMTLMALSLAVGIVVDDAVVVLENISTKLEQNPGMQPAEAASLGVGEIAFAVLATTLSLVALFVPLAFMPGMVGMYFRSWGITMAVAILLSMVVSFTLTPMLCARWLKPYQGEKAKAHDPWYQRLYIWVLDWSLKLRYLLLLGSAFIFLLSGPLVARVGKEFTTKEDQGNYTITLKLPHVWTIERVAEELRPLEQELRQLPHVENVLTSCDAVEGTIFVSLKDFDQRKPYTVFQSSQAARQILSRYHTFFPSIALGDRPPNDLDYTILGDDLVELKKLGQGVLQRLARVAGVVDLNLSIEPGQPEILVHLNADRTADLGVGVSQAGDAIQAAVAGLKVSTFQVGNRGYDVKVQVLPAQRAQPQDVAAILVPSNRSPQAQVPLAQVADFTIAPSSSSIARYQRQRKVSVRANLIPPASLQDATSTADKALKELNPPLGYGPVATGDAKLMAETAMAAFQSFLLSVLFMYMIMASQFENLLEPVLILSTLPLAVPFALFSLIAAGMTLNIFSVLGLFLLFGVVKKNAILQIDRTNQLKASGLSSREAILEANRDRLRPILMTTITLVVAMIPVALGGPTGAARAPMAMVVVGGQSLCLLLTLVVVPAGSAALEDCERLWNGLKSWAGGRKKV